MLLLTVFLQIAVIIKFVKVFTLRLNYLKLLGINKLAVLVNKCQSAIGESNLITQDTDTALYSANSITLFTVVLVSAVRQNSVLLLTESALFFTKPNPILMMNVIAVQ